jgi:hypothetical protein
VNTTTTAPRVEPTVFRVRFLPDDMPDVNGWDSYLRLQADGT